MNTGDAYHKLSINPLMLKQLGNIKGKKILDLACGNGYFSNILEKKGVIVTGADYSKNLISIAKRKFPNINFFVGSANKLNFLKQNSFDFIASNMAFHDIKNIEGTVKECSRILKNKGKLIFSIPHPIFTFSEFVNEDKQYSRKISKYMKKREIDHPSFKGVKHYHRPIDFYLNLLFKNKFVVSGFHEITTNHNIKGEVEKNKELLEHKKEIPYFLIIQGTLIN